MIGGTFEVFTRPLIIYYPPLATPLNRLSTTAPAERYSDSRNRSRNHLYRL